MSEYKEKRIHRTIGLPNFYEKIDLLDSLTYGGVRGRNFSVNRNSSYSISVLSGAHFNE